MALTLSTGRVYVWGSGQNGQLGLGSVKSCEFPVFVDFLSKEKIVDIVCGDSHVLTLSSKGTVYGWGQGISKSQSLIKSLRDSSMGSQNFQTYGDLYSSTPIKNDTQQLDVICFFPRQISEVDIAHTFLLKKKETLH
jgi:alpha-tubulin suppressor-like RCC1 family protein